MWLGALASHCFGSLPYMQPPPAHFETEIHGNHKEDQGKDFSSGNSSNVHAVVVRYRSKRCDCHDVEFVANLIDFRESIGGHK
jgi:hypothetical protein